MDHKALPDPLSMLVRIACSMDSRSSGRATLMNCILQYMRNHTEKASFLPDPQRKHTSPIKPNISAMWRMPSSNRSPSSLKWRPRCPWPNRRAKLSSNSFPMEKKRDKQELLRLRLDKKAAKSAGARFPKERNKCLERGKCCKSLIKNPVGQQEQ